MKIKTKTTNKIISFLLVFCMILSMIPNIFAVDTITTIFYIEKFYDDNNGYYGDRPSTTTFYIYGTNTENDTTNGEYIDSRIISKSNPNTDNPNLYTLTFKINAQDYKYYYITEENSKSYKSDVEWQSEITTTNLNPNSEEFNNIISKHNITDPSTTKVVKFNLNTTPVERTYNYNLTSLWNDDNNIRGKRPESIDIKIWGFSSRYEITSRKLLDTFTISTEDMIDENTWKIENKQIITGFPYIMIEPMYYEEMEEGKYTVIKPNYLFFKDMGNEPFEFIIKNSYGFYHSLNVSVSWYDNNIDTQRDDVTIKIYGTDNIEDRINKTNGVLLKTLIMTPEDKKTENSWSRIDSMANDTRYQYYYAEISSSIYNNKLYKITYESFYDDLDLIELNLANTLMIDQDINLTITWNDTETNPIPDELTLNISGTDLNYQTILAESITVTKNDDLDLDGNPNTWELFFENIKMPAHLNYIKIEADTSNSVHAQYAYSSEAALKVTDGPTIINMDANFVSIPQVMNFIFNWNDNNNENKERPTSISFDVYGADKAYNYEEGRFYNKTFLETVTMTEADLSPTDPNQWKKTITFDTSCNVLYVDATSVKTENEKYTGRVNTRKINSSDPATYTTTMSGTYGYENNFKISYNWIDNSNSGGVRPSNVKIKIYGTNTIDDTENGTLIFEENRSVSNTNIQTIFTSEKYDYLYCKAEINNPETSKGIYAVKNISSSTSLASEYNNYTAYTSFSININLEKEVKLHIIKKWEDSNAIEGKRPQSITFKFYSTQYSYYPTLVDSITLTPENPDADIWEFNTSISCAYTSFTITEVFDNKESYLDPEISIERTDDGTLKYSSFNIESTSIYAEHNRIVSFNITKTWNDNNNSFNERPEEIILKLYGTNIKNATSNGELLETINLSTTNDLKIDMDENTWEYKITNLKTSYNYFYITEEFNTSFTEGTYSLTTNIIEECFETESQSVMFNTQEIFDQIQNIQNEDEYAVSPMASHTYDFTLKKVWDDNNNEKGLRPEFIIVNIYGNASGIEETKELIAKVKLSEKKSELLYTSHFLNGYIWDDRPIDNTDPNVWIYADSFTDKDLYLWFEEENVKFEGENKGYYDVTMAYSVSELENVELTIINRYIDHPTYNIQLANTYTPTLKYIPLKITKIWRDDNNKYNTRPNSLDITVYQNGQVFDVLTFTSANMIGENINVWESTINVPNIDENNNKCIYTISEDESSLELEYYYYEPYINQNSLTAINVGIWLPAVEIGIIPEYSIVAGKEIINKDNEIATDEDFWKMKLDIDNTYEFPIVLKQLNRILSKGQLGMEESYEGYSGKEFKGILTNKGQLIFNGLEAGKYEISEVFNQYFDFIAIEEIESSEGASFTYENGKYYITLSGITRNSERIVIKIINKLENERFYNDLDLKENKIFVSDIDLINTVAAEMPRRSGMSGRLTIPDVNVNVALFEVSASDGAANQKITDKTDSAAFIPWGNQWLVADHYYQGFEKMKNSKIGTIAYINNGERMQAYICVEKAAGKNVSYTLLDNKGNDLYNRNAGGICMYTCNVVIYNGQDITYSLWQPVN